MQKENAVYITTDLLVIDGESLTVFARGSAGTVKNLKSNKKILCMKKSKIALPTSALERIVTFREKMKEGEDDG